MDTALNIRALPLRTKVAITMVAAVVVLLGAASWLSFSYWGDQAMDSARQQALLAAHQTRAAVEASLQIAGDGVLRRHLVEVMDDGALSAVRIYRRDGSLIYSTDPAEEGAGHSVAWIPESRSLPREGTIRHDEAAFELVVHLPLQAPGVAVLEATSSTLPIRSAMRRGALLGVGLSAASLLALGLILSVMLEREVIKPLARVERRLAAEMGVSDLSQQDEVRGIQQSMDTLLAREREVERRVEEQAGMAEVGQLATEMAHEFKRPLASIRSALDLLDREYQLDDAGRATMGAVNQQIAQLRETMEDLFSLARPVEIRSERILLTDVLNDALVEFAGYPDAGGIEVVRDYRIPTEVEGDARRLRQCFTNLMVNALEAMPGGGRLEIRAVHPDPGRVTITLRDTGSGIPPSEIEAVFRPFYSTKPQGTGLGLPLVARVIHAHGGQIAVLPVPEGGTEFHISLPALAPVEAGAGEGAAWQENAF